MTAYYNEIDKFCCKVLRARIADGSLPPGDVDDRDIREVSADDCRGYDQIHLFAGIGGFGYAARLAGLSDGFGILTGGFPCQPWSVAGRRGGASDDRHLWPEMLRLIREVRPQRVLGENVPGLDDAQYMALDGVLSDLEGAGYEGLPVEVPACAVDADHIRARLWIMAVPDSERGATVRGECADAAGEGDVGRAHGGRGAGDAERQESDGGAGEGSGYLADANSDYGQRWGEPLQVGRVGVTGEVAPDGCAGRTEWAPEPAVGGGFDGLPSQLDGGGLNGQAEDSRSREILQEMRNSVVSEAIRFWPLGGYGGVQEAEILRPPLLESTGTPQALGNVSLEGQAASQVVLRGVWFDQFSACASCRRVSREQLGGEHSDALRVLSQLLTCNCGATWLAKTGAHASDRWGGDWELNIPRVAHGVSRRVDRLRSLGNAIVPQVAAEIMRAMREAEA